MTESATYSRGIVSYLHGSEPAYEVEVWTRGQSQPGEAWGLRHGRVGTVLPNAGEKEFMAIPAAATLQERCPFKKFFDSDPGAGITYVGWMWKRLDGTAGQQDNIQATIDLDALTKESES